MPRTPITAPRCGRCGSRVGYEVEANTWEWRVVLGASERRYAIEKNARAYAARSGGRLEHRPVGEWREV